MSLEMEKGKGKENTNRKKKNYEEQLLHDCK